MNKGAVRGFVQFTKIAPGGISQPAIRNRSLRGSYSVTARQYRVVITERNVFRRNLWRYDSTII
jgi:hypothetical protein